MTLESVVRSAPPMITRLPFTASAAAASVFAGTVFAGTAFAGSIFAGSAGALPPLDAARTTSTAGDAAAAGLSDDTSLSSDPWTGDEPTAEQTATAHVRARNQRRVTRIMRSPSEREAGEAVRRRSQVLGRSAGARS